MVFFPVTLQMKASCKLPADVKPAEHRWKVNGFENGSYSGILNLPLISNKDEHLHDPCAQELFTPYNLISSCSSKHY